MGLSRDQFVRMRTRNFAQRESWRLELRWCAPSLARASLTVLALVASMSTFPEIARAAFPGADGLIAVERGNPAEIWTMTASGKNMTRLTQNSSIDADPAWSPGGLKIAFVSDRDGNDEIYVMNRSGGAQTRLTNDLAPDSQPSWSPDGNKIVFARLVGGISKLFVMDADGGNVVPLSTLEASWPAWSPDGTRIAFAGRSTAGDLDIFSMNANGSDPLNLTNNPYDDIAPVWMPDGSAIAFQSFRDASTYPSRRVYSMSPDGSGQAQVVGSGSFAGFPAWSPTGTRLAFISANTIGAGTKGTLSIATFDPPKIKDVSTTSGWTTPPDWQPLYVTATASESELDLGSRVTVSVHLVPNESTNKTVSLYATPLGGVPKLLASKEADTSGDVDFVVKPSRRTTFVARWEGDATHPASASLDVVVSVHARTTTRLRRFYATSGRYHLYHLGRPMFETGKVAPNHAGHKVYFIGQRRIGRAWRDALGGIASFRLGRDSTVTVFLSGASLGRYRFKNIFRGDKDHLPDTSPWAYARVTS
jgi:Tol biopolymer transport system component